MSLDHEIERGVRKRQLLGVAKLETCRHPGRRRFAPRELEHVLRHVHTHRPVPEPGELEREKSGSAADVQHVECRLRSPRPRDQSRMPGRALLVVEQPVRGSSIELRRAC